MQLDDEPSRPASSPSASILTLPIAAVVCLAALAALSLGADEALQWQVFVPAPHRDLAAAASVDTSVSLVIFGDSIDGFAVAEWCRHRAYSFCYSTKTKAKLYHSAQPEDECENMHREMLALAAIIPWSADLQILSCMPRTMDEKSGAVRGDGSGASTGTTSIIFYLNIFGAQNGRPKSVSNLPSPEVALADIWRAPLATAPRLLGAQPTALLVHSLFWDLYNVCETLEGGGGYASITDASDPSFANFVAGYAASVGGPLFDAVDKLTGEWPLLTRVWRTANLVDENLGSFRRNANALIRSANAAACVEAEARGFEVFDLESFPNASRLRDGHHPVKEVLIVALDTIIETARESQRAHAARRRLLK